LTSAPVISLCMIVKNEEQRLEHCLAAARPFVDEIVIADTGSNDRTIEIARSFSNQLLQFAWCSDFSAARNFAIDHASGNWILVLDADEELDEPSRAAMRPLLAGTPADGLICTVRNIQPTGSLVSYIDSTSTRLFRNHPDYRYQGAIHEQIQPGILDGGGQLASCELVVVHDGYTKKEAQGGQSRARRNLELLLNAVAQAPQDAYLAYQVGVTYKAMGSDPQAQDWLNKALQLEHLSLGAQTLTDLYLKLAQLALGRNDYNLAVQYARASLRFDPTNTFSRYVLALGYFYQRDTRRAFREFNQLRSDPRLDPASLSDIDQVMRYCRETIAKKGI
jgi:tetratricopeptide (TPR) repeat protein